jgi:hypothetical protein
MSSGSIIIYLYDAEKVSIHINNHVKFLGIYIYNPVLPGYSQNWNNR